MTDASSNDEDRVNDLEIKFSFQQEMIDSLNETVTKQWREIDQLKRNIERLEGRMQEMADGSDVPMGHEPPPPHY